MSTLRQTWQLLRHKASSALERGTELEEHMFVTGPVEQVLDIQGAAARVITTPAGSCAMLHFDSMVICLPFSLCMCPVPVSLCLSLSQ